MWSFFDLSSLQLALLDQVVGEFADMLRDRIVRVEEVERSGERVEEAIGDAPGVAAFAEHQALDLEILGRLADAQRDLLHVVVRADEHAEIGGLGGVGAEASRRPPPRAGPWRSRSGLPCAARRRSRRSASRAGCRRPSRSSGSSTRTPVSSSISSSSPASVAFSAFGGRPRLLPILNTLPMISLEYFWPMPIVSMMSRAAMEISAVSMP